LSYFAGRKTVNNHYWVVLSLDCDALYCSCHTTLGCTTCEALAAATPTIAASRQPSLLPADWIFKKFPSMFRDRVIALRSALVSNGYKSTKLIGPVTANYDSSFFVSDMYHFCDYHLTSIDFRLSKFKHFHSTQIY